MTSHTGNTGLGYEAIKAMYASSTPYTVLLGTRDLSKGESAIKQLQSEVPTSASTVHLLQIDVSSDASLEAAIETMTSHHGGRLDVLVNNAGAAFDGKVLDGTLSLREAFNASWDTNVSGTHVLTTLAVPLLLQSPDPRLIFVTSGASSLWETEEENWGNNVHLPRLNGSLPKGWPKPRDSTPVSAYRTSKTGLNMLMRGWVRTLKNDGVKVWAVSPGFLATGLGGVGPENLRKIGALEPSVGGEFLKDVVEGKHDDRVGRAIRVDQTQAW